MREAKDYLNNLKTETGRRIFLQYLRGVLSASDVRREKSYFADKEEKEVWEDLVYIDYRFLP